MHGVWTRGRSVATVSLIMAGLIVLVPPAYGVSPQTLMVQGAAYYREGALPQAEWAFSQAAAAMPAWAMPALWMGAVKVARGDRAGASAWFKEALRRHPTQAEQECAEVWLQRLGLSVTRPRWRVRTPEEYGLFVRAVNPALSAGQARWLGYALVGAANKYHLDPRLLASVVFVESRFNHQSISSAGAEGLAQLMPETAAELGVNPRDPLQNLVGAAWLLRLHIDEFHNIPLALAAYNAGGTAVRKYGTIPPYAETQFYVWAVLWVRDGLDDSSGGRAGTPL